ncbi:MAG: haloacid dehalogenase-like hydrolase [Clostridia bacterium]|nr:haloacid dehalogenase-like hydrolase [Clostridia bacterium]
MSNIDCQSNRTVALMYDFDKTLSTKDMQEYVFIPQLNMTPEQFWLMSDQMATKNNMDGILCTMFLMVNSAKKGNVDITKNALMAQGSKIKLHKGVKGWFPRITEYGNQLGLNVKHYVISSGLKTIIDGTSIAKYFAKIYASDFIYDQDGLPIWPSMAINYSSKTQFLYRIHKGVEDTNEHYKLNRRTNQADIQVPFSNMIYFGDGFTDVPAMKLTRMNGGYSIGVYQNKSNDYLVQDDRVSFYCPSDYSADTLLDRIVKTILLKISAEAELTTLGWDRLIVKQLP